MSTLTLKGLSKSGKFALYAGAANVLRIPVGAFINKTAPTTIEVEGNFAEAGVKSADLTPEEKAAKLAAAKAARAAKPKPTLEQRVAAAKARTDKLEAQLVASQASA